MTMFSIVMNAIRYLTYLLQKKWRLMLAYQIVADIEDCLEAGHD